MSVRRTQAAPQQPPAPAISHADRLRFTMMPLTKTLPKPGATDCAKRSLKEMLQEKAKREAEAAEIEEAEREAERLQRIKQQKSRQDVAIDAIDYYKKNFTAKEARKDMKYYLYILRFYGEESNAEDVRWLSLIHI